jgi:hypothetical protein
MREAVPSLITKISQHRPRIVCFVGKAIWLIVEAALKKDLAGGSEITKEGSPPEFLKKEEDLLKKEEDLLKKKEDLLKKEEDLLKKEEDLLKKEEDLLLTTPSKSPRRKKTPVQASRYGLQPYKFVYSDKEGLFRYEYMIHIKISQMSLSINSSRLKNHLDFWRETSRKLCFS